MARTRSRGAIALAVVLAAIAVGLAAVSLIPAGTVLDGLGLDGSSESARAFARHGLLRARWLALPGLGVAALLSTPAASRWLRRSLEEAGHSAARVRVRLQQGRADVSPTEWLVLGGLILLGVVLRVRFAGRPLLWDEGTTFFNYAIRPWWVAMAWYPEPNNHVFHSALTSVSVSLFGPSLWALRLPALVSGTLQIPAAWLATRLLGGSRAAITATALVATSSVLTGFSVNSRGYALIGLLLLLLVVTATLLRENDEQVLWMAFVVISSVGLFTVPVMLDAIAFVVAWLLASSVAGDSRLRPAALVRRIFVAGLATVVLTLLLYLPVLVVSGPRVLFANPFVLPLSWPEFIMKWRHEVLVPTAAQWSANVPRWLVATFVLALVPAVVGIGPDRRARIPVTAGLVGPLVLALLTRTATPPRVWSMLAPVYLSLVAMGLVALGTGLSRLLPRTVRLPLAVAAVTGIVGVVALRTARATYLFSEEIETETMPEGRQVVARLASELHEGDVVVANFPFSRVMHFELMRAGLDRFLSTQPGDVRRALIVAPSRSPRGPNSALRWSHLRDRISDPGRVLLEEGKVRIWALEVRPCPAGPDAC